MKRIVLVTGAAKGIGFEIARRFLLGGARVVVNDLTAEHVSLGMQKLPITYEKNVLGCAADVSDHDQVVNMVSKVMDRWGAIDVLINNAGIYPSHKFLEMTEADWDKVIDVNAKGIFLVSQAVARAMVAEGIHGHIVNISSGSYHVAREGSAHYCASKAAGIMLTKVMAMELAQFGIQVNAVAPGLIQVESMNAAPEYIEATRKQTPVGKVGQPEDVADVVYHLVNMATGYITGAVIAVDGGLSLGRFGIPRS